jgi:hypothetical protein
MQFCVTRVILRDLAALVPQIFHSLQKITHFLTGYINSYCLKVNKKYKKFYDYYLIKLYYAVLACHIYSVTRIRYFYPHLALSRVFFFTSPIMVRKPFQILNKCDDRYTFQINRVPTWIPDFILKNTMNAL